MQIVFLGPKVFSKQMSGGQKRFKEAINCSGVDHDSVITSFNQSFKYFFKKNITFIAFDERYLFVGLFFLLSGKRVVFFPRGNKLIHFKDSHSPFRLYIYKKVFSWLYRHCVFLVFQTNAQALEFKEMYSYQGTYKILPNNINASWIKSFEISLVDNFLTLVDGLPHPKNETTWRVGFMGGLDKRKGFDLAYKSLQGLITEGLINLHVAGEKVDQFEGYNVVAHGYLTDNELIEFYKNCDFIIIPSKYDSFPNVLLEALAYNTIPLISRDHITEEIVGHNSILLFDRTILGISGHLKNLIDKPELMFSAEVECRLLREKYTFDWCAEIKKNLEI